MGAQDQMIAAVNAAEAAVQQLAQAYRDYTTGYRAAAQAVYASDPRMQATGELEQAVSAERVAQFVHGRLVALGAERIVVPHPGGMMPVDAGWAAWLIGQVQHHVPDDAVATR